MKLSLAIQTPEVDVTVPVALLSGSLEEKLTKAAALGADGVEFMTVDPQALDAAAIGRELQRRGLEAAAIGSGAAAMAAGLTLLHADPQIAAKARQRLLDMVDFAAAVGAPLVTIGSFRGRAAWVSESGPERLATILHEGASYAAGKRVRLALEPVNRYENDLFPTAAAALAFAEEVNHPSLGLLVDTFHANIEESSWREPFTCATEAGRLWHVHLGDNNRLAPGWGMIDFAHIVGILRELGYDGYLSAELLARPDPDAAARQTIRHMRALLDGATPG